MSRSFNTATKELLIFLFFIIFPILSRAEGFEFQNPFLIPGRVEGEGTYFEIKESEYLNVSLKSDKKVRVTLESMPKLISLMVEESKENGSEKANLIIENLEPNKIYYKYEDSYKNVAEVYSGNEGKYEWEQDLSKAHHIWFQEEKSTIFLPRDCSNYGNWDASTQTCILNQDLNQSVEIDENNITLDCANYSIVGNNEGYGIYLNSKTGVKIKNCKVRNFVRGLSLSSSNNNKFENNTFSNNETGIYLHASYNNEFRKNIIENNSWLGFTLDYNSQNNILRENQMQNNKFNFLSFGYENDIDTTNLVNGKPIYYLIDASNITLDSSSNAGTVHCIRCSNITLKDLNLKNNFFGIFLSNSKNLKIEGNKIEENNIGIYLLNSQGILVTENTLTNNYLDIFLELSRDNLLKKNKIKNEVFYYNFGGINLHYSNNNTLSDNNFFKKGIVIFSSSQNTLNGNNILNSPYGISITLSSENNILGNFLSENGNSIYLNWSPKNILKNNKIEKSRLSGVYFYNSSENLFTQNTLTENTIGIFSLDSAKNYIYHNNFINNQTQAKTNNQENFFDNGYPEGGNYWSDYAGVDEKSGQDQNQEGLDGIGDTPYCFENDCDQYPLMGKKEENLISQKWEFDVNFQYNLDGNLETIEGQGESSGEIFLSQDELKIEGVFSLNGNFPTQIPKISLISTDGFKKELSSSTISFNTISYFQAGPNSYHFSLSISNPPRPENNGHYELYLEIEGTPFFINTNSKINKNYLPLIVFKNQPPTPIIEFFPKSPVKGTKVKFDDTKSFDFDGEIVNFEWQIASTTFYGTTTEFTFDENGEYQITLTVTDNDGATSSTSTTIKVEPFSFAIITDLHIGRGYPDYGSEGFDDEDNGEEYYLTQRLRDVVKWINQNKDNIQCDNATCSIKFLAVLGDVADTAEKSEFCKAKEILDKLEIPYIPVFGNHDVWPYTEKESATTTLGEDFFERIFWSTSIPCENASSTKNFEILLRDFNFERDMQNSKFKNFAFTFGGIHFIGLDFNSREREEKWYLGPTGAKARAVTHPETIEWLKKKLNELEGKEPVIILSHEPFAKPYSRSYFTLGSYGFIKFPTKDGNFSEEELKEINQILEDYEDKFEGQQVLVNFGGHIHGFEKIGKELRFFGQFSPFDLYFDANWQYPSLSTVPVLTTEALMVGGNEKDLSNKGLVRIVKIEDKEKIDFSEIEFKEPALNPYITFEFKSKIVGNFIYPCLIFVPQTFSKREIDYYLWNFDDGKTERTSPLIWEGKTIHCYSPSSLPATYSVTLIAIDKETNKSEYITKKVEIREGIIPKIIKIGEDLKDKVELMSMELNEKVTEFGRTMRDWVWVKMKHSPATSVGLISVHFENALEDIDLLQLKVDIDFQNKKSLLYMPQWPSEIERSKILFVPK